MCWCVDANGNEIPNTRQTGAPNCDKPSIKPINDILNAIIPPIPNVLEKFARLCFCDSLYKDKCILSEFSSCIQFL